MNLEIYRLNHHHPGGPCAKSAAILWANLNLLYWMSLIPFATAWMAENGFATTTVSICGVVCVPSDLAYTALQTVIVASHGPDSLLKAALGRDLKAKGSLVAYVVSVPLAVVSRWASAAIFIGVALLWMIPDRRLQDCMKSTLDGGGSSG